MKKKRTLKGFTLLELIIVMALFSVIMMMVMSFIDPVSGIMKKTSVRERSAAYVDNISDYISKSMKYAKFVRVFDGDFCNGSDPTSVSEHDAVETFVNDFFDGVVDSGNLKMTGTVRILTLSNDPADAGKVTEKTWDFVAGDSVPMLDNSDPTNPVKYRDFTHGDNCELHEGTEEEVINPDTFESYSYYYQLGYNTFDKAGDVDSATKSAQGIRASEDCYYSRLNYQFNADGTPIENAVEVSRNSFSLSIVAYLDNSKDGHRKIDIADTDAYGDPITVPAFISPAYMSVASMSFPNVGNSASSISGQYYRIVQENNTGAIEYVDPSGTVPKLEAITASDFYDTPFSYYKAASGNKIHFIYVIPSELSV